MPRQSRLGSVLLFWLCACHSDPPPRLPTIPPSAAWGGGSDGGFWIDCRKLPGDTQRFECATYNAHTGTVYSTGIYFPNVDVNSITLTPKAYDAQGRIAINDTVTLRANGAVTFPFDSISGKRQMFRYGEAVGDEEQY